MSWECGGEEDGSKEDGDLYFCHSRAYLESYAPPDMGVLKPSWSLAIWDEIVCEKIVEQNIILQNWGGTC